MTSSDKPSNLEKLLAFTRDFGAASDSNQLIQRISTAAAKLTNSESSSILRYDNSSSSLHFVASQWLHQDNLRKINVPISASLAGWSFVNNKPLIITDMAKEPRHYKAIDQATEFKTTSLLAVPLNYQGTTIGVIEVVNKLGSTNYTEEDVSLLEIIALNAAMALWNYNLGEHFKTPNDEFSELNRLKSNFIAITSHELRTPLGLILGHATFLKEMIAEKYHEPVDTIIRNANRLKEIVESLTNVDNYETGEARIRQNTVSISGVVEDVIASFQDMAKSKNITLKSEEGEKISQVKADVNKITVAISNLIRNAITFTDEGGQVLVSIKKVTGHVKFSVKDNGVGIPANDLAHVFDRFFQVESHLIRRHSGMGLGLSVAKTMIELHGGRIWVESVEGQGSTFIFLLPLKPKKMKTFKQAFSS